MKSQNRRILVAVKPTMTKGGMSMSPNLEIYERVKDKPLFFTAVQLSEIEVFSYFPKEEDKATSIYTYLKYSEKGESMQEYIRALRPLSECQIIDYSHNIRELLTLENLYDEKQTTLEKNTLNTRIRFLRTFKRAELIHRLIHKQNAEVVYTNVVTAYSLTKLYPEEFDIFYDVPKEIDLEKYLSYLDFNFSAYTFFKDWHRSMKPHIEGDWGNGKLFKLWYRGTAIANNGIIPIEGYISDENGMQYFTGTKTNENLDINTKYFISGNTQRKDLVCYSPQKKHFHLKDGKGFYGRDFQKSVKNFTFTAI